jgi:hypothetical protein
MKNTFLLVLMVLFGLPGLARTPPAVDEAQSVYDSPPCDEQPQGVYSDSQYESNKHPGRASRHKAGYRWHFEALARPENLWNDTGINVKAGERFYISVVGGQWFSNPYWASCLGAGNSRYLAASSYLLPGAPEGVLIGRIGNGPAFSIGNGARTPANAVGRLRVTVNDEPVGFGDNSGSLKLVIQKL